MVTLDELLGWLHLTLAQAASCLDLAAAQAEVAAMSDLAARLAELGEQVAELRDTTPLGQ